MFETCMLFVSHESNLSMCNAMFVCCFKDTIQFSSCLEVIIFYLQFIVRVVTQFSNLSTKECSIALFINCFSNSFAVCKQTDIF